jgi:hypothetical protein
MPTESWRSILALAADHANSTPGCCVGALLKRRGGGNHPKASNKETVNGPVSGGGAFPVRNGQTTGTISVGPPGAGDFSCPNGQDLVLASVCYANVTLTGQGGDTATATPNPACRTLFNI